MKTRILILLLLALGAGLRAEALSPTAQAPATKKAGAKKVASILHRGKKTAVTAAPVSATATVAAKKQHWVCPMHDGGESDHAGKCPKCGMDLELEKD